MAKSEKLEKRFRELRRSLNALPEVSEPPKSTLQIIGAARSEQTWNTLLAYFLDPNQPHGFGIDLLTKFLDRIQQETATPLEYNYYQLKKIEIETEVESPDKNRPDVVLRVPGEWFLCIESKVDSKEGNRQTIRYVQDPNLGDEKKSEYPDGRRHYVFLSKSRAPDANAAEFSNLYWQHVVKGFETVLEKSNGRYPERSVSQLREFLSTMTQVINMENDNFMEIQKEKVQLLGEYRNEIDTLFEAAESLRQRSIENWPELFKIHVDENLWTDDWHVRPNYGKKGCIFKDGWYLDNTNLNPTLERQEAGFRMHFVHLIRNKESFSKGELTFVFQSSTKGDLRNEFHRLYNSDRWQNRIKPILDDAKITNKGGQKDYTQKRYTVDQSRLPESYFETLATAFAEHQQVADIADEILSEAVDDVQES